MIERELCSYLICDECPDDDPEVGPYGSDERLAKDLAKDEGWRVDGDEHVCGSCIEANKYEECAADGGHDPVLIGRFPTSGAALYECRDCGFSHVDEQPALIDIPEGATA